MKMRFTEHRISVRRIVGSTALSRLLVATGLVMGAGLWASAFLILSM
jgi:hypothetical protein